MKRYSLQKARAYLKNSSLNLDPDSDIRLVISNDIGFKLTSNKLSIPNLDPGEYKLELNEILNKEEKLLSSFEFEVLETDINKKTEDTETQKIEAKVYDPKDEIINFLKSQIENSEKNFAMRLQLAINSTEEIYKAKIQQLEYQLKLEKENQNKLEQERNSIAKSIERNLRSEIRFKEKPSEIDQILPLIEKMLPFLVQSSNPDLKNSALLNAAKILENEIP